MMGFWWRILVSRQNLSQLKVSLKATVLHPLIAFNKEEIKEELKNLIQFNSS